MAKGQPYRVRRRLSKFGNVPTTVGGKRFHSKKEAMRYLVLKDMERKGEIEALSCQPVFPITVAGVRIGKYVGDFTYTLPGIPPGVVCEDVKSEITRKEPLFRWKWKLVQALYPGIEWRVT